ncbi:MAG: 3-isopropylmalate dehydratase large subunit [Helicobacteraceae bacterium]|jgi:3-isopropylmalate/(R)-2-methylmalate dehydratase large subunit|nr:3-isopropylmalate dehydratase large subunit [Helicobacteraceae bacterium]
MGLTITEKIFSDHNGETARAGEIVRVKVDMTISNDITMPLSIRAFERAGAKRLADSNRFALCMDHFIPAQNINAANQARISRDFALKHDLPYFFDEKDMGIEHALLPEKGLISPGDIIIGSDSHTCTHGALGAFATGMGSTDLAYAMATGTNWFKVPASIKVELRGKPAKHIYGKDLILETIATLGISGGTYKALEFVGDALEHLGMDDRFSLCNMAVEAGAKNGIIACDRVAEAFLSDKKLARKPKIFASDADASYERTITIDADKMEPIVAFPFLPDNKRVISEAARIGVKIDQAFIGSCTNGRISDLRIAASILKGRKVAKRARLIITPATQKIALQAQKEGLYEIFAEAGALVSNPTCGACFGGYMGILGDKERCISSNNRNFVGRMGANTSEIYLANPAVVAASAIAGEITDPRSFS